jgi:hypothetical protein
VVVRLIGAPASGSSLELPIGSPRIEARGKLTAGVPARFAVMVNTSARYIARGSSDLAPNGNAGSGVVGRSIASTLSKARAKSRPTRLRTFWAFS